MPSKRPNITYIGGPYSGAEDYRAPPFPARITDELHPGEYRNTGRVRRGHVEYEWVSYEAGTDIGDRR
jgi:hypothetical protein